jgi:hypothetical protein
MVRLSDQLLKLPPLGVDQVAALASARLSRAGCLPVLCEVVGDILRHSSPVDWVPFLREPWYREHLFHQVRTAQIGDYLLDKGILDWTHLPHGLTRKKLRALAWAAGVLHDHGYALSHLACVIPAMFDSSSLPLSQHGKTMFDLLLQCYDAMYAQRLVHRFCSYLKLPGSGEGGNASEPPCKGSGSPNSPHRSMRASVSAPASVVKVGDEVYHEVRSAIEEYLGPACVGLSPGVVQRLAHPQDPQRERECLRDHGVWSALNLAARLDESGMPWQDRPDQTPLIGMLLEGIAIHSRPDFQGNDFDVGRNPIAGLLALSDELHEWGRRVVPSQDAMEIRCDVWLGRAASKAVAVRYRYADEDLEKAGWPLKEARKDKSKAFHRLRGAVGFAAVNAEVCSKRTGVRSRRPRDW